MKKKEVPVVLTIAGSDPSGGAGIAADIKVFTELCVYSAYVITSITAQNTRKVECIHDIEKDIFYKQMSSVLEDIKPLAFKTGMIHSPFVPEIVSYFIRKYKLKNYILDPVIISTSGKILCNKDTMKLIIKNLFPHAFIVTPNLNEAEFLSGIRIRNTEDMIAAAQKIHDMGPLNVILKGGHLKGSSVKDLLYTANGKFKFFEHPRVRGIVTHGTGCSLSAALVAFIAKGYSIEDSIKMSSSYVYNAIRKSFRVGKGAFPLNHFWKRLEL